VNKPFFQTPECVHVMKQSAIIQRTKFWRSISGPFPKTPFDKYCGRDGAPTTLL